MRCVCGLGILFIWLLVGCAAAPSPVGEVRDTTPLARVVLVIRDSAGQPVPAALIYSHWNDQPVDPTTALTSTADLEGIYRLSITVRTPSAAQPPTDLTLLIAAPAYLSQTVRLTPQAGMTLTTTVVLTPQQP